MNARISCECVNQDMQNPAAASNGGSRLGHYLALMWSLLILVGSANSGTLQAAISSGFASVTIENQTQEDIIVRSSKK
jgi:hypothetical protein